MLEGSQNEPRSRNLPESDSEKEAQTKPQPKSQCGENPRQNQRVCGDKEVQSNNGTRTVRRTRRMKIIEKRSKGEFGGSGCRESTFCFVSIFRL